MQEQASSHSDPRAARRPATADEARMLGNPLRIRILRITLDQPLTNKEIADRLGVTEVTVKAHLRNLYGKLGANNRAHAVTIALQQKIIE